MKNRTVKQYIILGFAAVILIMAALSGFAFVLFYEIRTKVADINSETLPGLYLSSQIESLSMDIVGTVYRHALSSDAPEKRQLESEIAANQTRLETASREYEKTISTAGDRQLFGSIADARSACEAAYTPVLELSRNAQINDVRVSLRGQVDPACKVLRKSTQAEFEDNKRLGEEASHGILDAVSRAEQGVVIALAIGIILAGASGYMLIRSVNRLVGQVQESGLKVSTSSAEIAATSQEQLSTANEIAATTSEIGATAKQISVTSRELVQTMKSVAEVAERTTALAGSGQLGLGRMKITVQQIVEASGSITDRLAVLNEKAGNIGTVVTTITKVADQTNLLSLNAAIEAEKAGEYGRGFAVVATEIRRLADQTAVSTSDIEQTVKEIQSAVAAGVMGMDKFSEEVRRGVDVVQQVSEELTQIIQQVQTLTPSFETVSEGMQSQSVGAQQISDALGQLSEAATQTVGSLRQSNVAVEQLNEAARGLQTGISRFVLQA